MTPDSDHSAETGSKANSDSDPDSDSGAAHVAQAQEAQEETATTQSCAVDYEQSEEVQKMLRGSPYALPLPVEMLRENRVGVSEIPKGHLLNNCVGDLDVRVSDNEPKSHPGNLNAFRKQSRSESSSNEWSKNKETSLVSTPLPSTNKNRNPNSRWFIRGVLHNRSLHVRLGALASMLILWLVPAALISVVLLILSSELPDSFGWVSPPLIWLPVAMALVGILYLLFGLTSSCCVCNQKLFVYGSRLKNTKAHHITGLGYILPLCLHLLVFRWFRCAQCGTPIRLKK